MVTDSDFLASDFDSIQSEDIKHVWYFQPILEHVFIQTRSVYDAQLSFVTIYKVGKCMMPSVLKICSDFKSSVFQP